MAEASSSSTIAAAAAARPARSDIDSNVLLSRSLDHGAGSGLMAMSMRQHQQHRGSGGLAGSAATGRNPQQNDSSNNPIGGGGEGRAGSVTTSTAVQREVSSTYYGSDNDGPTVSAISYAGYLLKRSNHPYNRGGGRESPPPLFPMDPPLTSSYNNSHNNNINNSRRSSASSLLMFAQENDELLYMMSSGTDDGDEHIMMENNDTNTADGDDDNGDPRRQPQPQQQPLHLFADGAPTPEDHTINQTEVTSIDGDNSKTDVKTDEKAEGLGLEFFASLIFGIQVPKPKELPSSPSHQQQQARENQQAQQQQLEQPSPTMATTMLPFRRSAPIKVGSSGSNIMNSRNSFRLQDSPQSASPLTPEMSGLTTAAITTLPSTAVDLDSGGGGGSSSNSSKPSDYIDPLDGHIWRAKYCVLEYDTLFFYRNQAVAESPKAVAERQQLYAEMNDDTPPTAAAVADLALSPMPQRPIITATSSSARMLMMPMQQHTPQDDDNEPRPEEAGPSPAAGAAPLLCEKRVALEQVGAVRSAEVEYGPHAFELTAGDDVSDKLVLRARNGDEMNEWLFQFHRCIASFVMDMMDHVAVSAGATSPMIHRAQIGDIHHPTFQQEYSVPERADVEKPLSASFVETSPIRRGRSLTTAVNATTLSSYSPRYQKMLYASASASDTPPNSRKASLSHGHGRSSMHRRRSVEGRTPSSGIRLTASEDTSMSPTLPFPMLDRPDAKKLNNLVTPLQSMAPRYTPPPPSDSFAAAAAAAAAATSPDMPPEIIAPPEEHPETEHPPGNLDGKYVPPHLRSKDGGGGGKYVPPHLRRPQAKYVPPHLRQSPSTATTPDRYVPRHLRGGPGNNSEPDGIVSSSSSSSSPFSTPPPRKTANDLPTMTRKMQGSMMSPVPSASMDSSDYDYDKGDDGKDVAAAARYILKLGGCADPVYVSGSILDDEFIPRKASRLEKVHTSPFGYASSDAAQEDNNNNTGASSSSSPSSNGPRRRRLRWEIGAFSECGIRESNEDAYLVTSNLVEAFTAVETEHSAETVWNQFGVTAESHPPGLFAIFDGHCGDQASRFAAERLTRFIYDESLLRTKTTAAAAAATTDGMNMAETSACTTTDELVEILDRAIHRLDDEFCNICVKGEREWESGSTALIVALANEHLIVANLGDARGIVGRSVASGDDSADHEKRGWNELPFDDYTGGDDRRCLWKEVTDVHSPNRQDERDRIERAGGWVTTEREIPVGQIKRLALYDDDVIDILKRCFADRYQPSPKASAPHRFLKISRVCGELAVSRALGDRDFKASHNIPESKSSADGRTSRAVAETIVWDSSHLFLSYPEGHNQNFVGDLVTNKPDFQALRVGEEGVLEEFLLLACDGLWDVIDQEDAYRVTRDLLFEKQWSAKKAAGRLAELAVHLGSSDNITVIVVRFFRST